MSEEKEKSLTIVKSRAVKIFEVLGFKTANKWDATRLQKKLAKLEILVEGAKLDDKTQKRVDEVLHAQKSGCAVIVIDVEKETPNKRIEQDAKEIVEQEVEQEVEKKEQTTKEKKEIAKEKTKVTKKQKEKITEKIKDKVPGVIMSVLEFVKTQGPISEKKLLSLLKKRFPGRNSESMERTIPRIPGHLAREKGLDVIGKDDEGRYVIKK